MRLALTMGDPAGIGPEIIAKALSVRDVRAWAEVLVYGDVDVMRAAVRAASLSLDVCATDSLLDGADAGRIYVRPVSRLDEVEPARPTPASDAAQLAYIREATADVQAHRMDALVTAPISKASIRRAGATWPGHTEMLANLTKAQQAPVMMMAGEQLRTVPVTVHCPLSAVPSRLSTDLIRRTLTVVDAALRTYFNTESPRIAVAGLNPHAGESGLFGHEDVDVIQPAVEAAQADGLRVVGPLPADTVFLRAVQGDYDAVLGMYHDQALIPVKLMDFDRTVNVTLGLPIIRTSVDHGTAYDIAGQGVASATSLLSAIRLAAKMVRSAQDR